MEPDYPAAHSMDTCFFAIDRDGHVACFDTNEAGAVPANALSGDDAYSVRQQFGRLPRVGIVHDLKGRQIPGRRNNFQEHGGQFGMPYPTLMFLAALDPVQEEIAAGRAVEVPASEGVAVVFQELAEELAKRLHDDGLCLGCTWNIHSAEMEVHAPDLAARGIYSYTHLTENWISGPYGRVCRPEQPIHVDQLPPRLREAIKGLRFESLCFAETLHIQPVEHAPCVSWESAYMDVTGQHIRPIPGKEAEYAGTYEDLADIGGEDGVQIEPPSESNPEAADE